MGTLAGRGDVLAGWEVQGALTVRQLHPCDSLLHLRDWPRPHQPLCGEAAKTGRSDQRSALLGQRTARETQNAAGAKAASWTQNDGRGAGEWDPRCQGCLSERLLCSVSAPAPSAICRTCQAPCNECLQAKLLLKGDAPVWSLGRKIEGPCCQLICQLCCRLLWRSAPRSSHSGRQ